MARQTRPFNVKTFLSTVGVGREMMSLRKGQSVYAQGGAPEALFVIQQGRVKISVKSQTGKGSTLNILDRGDFAGTDCLAGVASRVASATAMTDCRLLRIDKKNMMLALARQAKLSNMFWAYLLDSNIRYQQDLVEHTTVITARRDSRAFCCAWPTSTARKPQFPV